MKRLAILVGVVLLAAGALYWLAQSRAQSPEPNSVLKKAIEAHGGEKNISKPRIGVLKVSSKGGASEMTQEETFDLPKRWKRVTTIDYKGKRSVSFHLMSGGKLWQWEDGEEARQAKLDDTHSYFGPLTVLLELGHEKWKLSPLEKTRVNGQSTVGFRAVFDAGGADHYFDKTSGLLVQTIFTWQPEPGKEVETKMVYSDYKEVDGIKFPHRKSLCFKERDSKEYVSMGDFIITEVRILDTIPEEVFSLPGGKQ